MLLATSATVALVLGVSVVGLLGFCINRLYFHPLRKYPGPLLGRITNLYAAYHAWTGDMHVDMWRCHEKYGDVVRYAPNRLLFYNAPAINEIYGSRSNVIKSKVYDTLTHRSANTFTLRDKNEHARRRRVMSNGFSDAAIRLLEPKIVEQVRKSLNALLNHSDESTKVGSSRGEWGVPRDMSICASYDTLAQEKYRYVPRAIESSNVRMSTILQAPVLTSWRLDKKLFPESIVARNRFLKFMNLLVGYRASHPEGRKKDGDIFSMFQHAQDPETSQGFTLDELCGESATLIVAGSDTTSTALAALFHYLSQDEDAYEQVSAEVRQKFSAVEEIRLGANLSSCMHLRACADEALRMSPSSGGALWREVSPGGATISGHAIPAGCDVGIGIYAMHHNPEYHPEPFQFRHARFLGREASVGNSRQAFIPFSVGPRGCIGKGLAMNEIMLTMATVLWSSDFRRAKQGGSYDQRKVVQPTEYLLKDHITGAKRGPLLEFRSRHGMI